MELKAKLDRHGLFQNLNDKRMSLKEKSDDLRRIEEQYIHENIDKLTFFEEDLKLHHRIFIIDNEIQPKNKRITTRLKYNKENLDEKKKKYEYYLIFTNRKFFESTRDDRRNDRRYYDGEISFDDRSRDRRYYDREISFDGRSRDRRDDRSKDRRYYDREISFNFRDYRG